MGHLYRALVTLCLWAPVAMANSGLAEFDTAGKNFDSLVVQIVIRLLVIAAAAGLYALCGGHVGVGAISVLVLVIVMGAFLGGAQTWLGWVGLSYGATLVPLVVP